MYPSVEGLPPILTLGLLAAFLAWSGLTVAAIAGRLHFDRRERASAMSDSLPLSGRRTARLVRHASRHRTESGKWRRAAALRTLTASGHPRSRALVRRALSDPDRDIAGAAIKALGDLGTPWAQEHLIVALRADFYQRSRTAAQLERFTPDLGPSLVELLEDPDPTVRFWGATLLGHCPGLALDSLIVLTRDQNANVRCAAIEALSTRGDVQALAAVRHRLTDEQWFVRVHACRAVGALGTIDDAPLIARALGDPWWWARSAAKEALCGFGPAVAGVVIPYLDDEDEFARNGAAEVLQDIGFVDSLAATGVEGRLLERILASGGRGMRDAAEVRGELLEDEGRMRLAAVGGECA